jgi:hypothetical protein
MNSSVNDSNSSKDCDSNEDLHRELEDRFGRSMVIFTDDATAPC